MYLTLLKKHEVNILLEEDLFIVKHLQDDSFTLND